MVPAFHRSCILNLVTRSPNLNVTNGYSPQTWLLFDPLLRCQAVDLMHKSNEIGRLDSHIFSRIGFVRVQALTSPGWPVLQGRFTGSWSSGHVALSRIHQNLIGPV